MTVATWLELAFGCHLPFRRDDYGLDGNRNEGMRRLPFAGKGLSWRYGEGLDFVIHPGMEHEVARLHFGLQSNQLPSGG